jgi:transglutaminase-like putative cysteine protease
MLLGLSLAVLNMSPATAFDFSKSGEEILLPAETSAISIWVPVPAEDGDTVSEYCYSFLRTQGVSDIISTYQCSEAAMGVNGFTGWNDFTKIQIGQMVLLPSPDNDPALIRALASAVSLRENPMGMASEIRRLAIADDAITDRLSALETTQLSPEDVQGLINSALAGIVDTGVNQAVFDTAVRAVNNRIDGLGGVTASEVSAKIAEALLAANVPTLRVMEAIDVGLTSLSDRLTAVEVEQTRLAREVTTLRNLTTAVADVLDSKVNTTDLTAEIGGVNARIDGLTGVTSSVVTKLIDARLDGRDADSMGWWWLVFGLAALATVATVILAFKKPSAGELAAVVKLVDDKVAVVTEELAAVREVAAKATKDAAATSQKADTLTDRLRDVEEVQVLQLTLDAQGRFNCPELSEKRLKDLGDNELLVLEIQCLDNRARKVHVSKGVGGDGNPRLHFLGLKKGHDFIDTISLVALYRHLAQARLEEWIIGITAAAKAA